MFKQPLGRGGAVMLLLVAAVAGGPYAAAQQNAPVLSGRVANWDGGEA